MMKFSPLMWATQHGDMKLTKMLIDAGADPNYANPRGITALTLAASNGATSIAKVLLEAGADPELSAKDIPTPLMAATNHSAIMDLLLAHGADVNQTDEQGRTALLAAASRFPGKGVKPLLKAGADPNGRGPDGDLPLLAAVQHKVVHPVRWLLDAGADPNVCFDKASTWDQSIRKGTTPLMYAAETGRAKLVEILLEAGADPAAKDSANQTALDLAWNKGHSRIGEMIQSRLPEAAQAGKSRTQKQWSAMLLAAAKRGDIDDAERAIAAGADLNAADSVGEDFGKTPVALACEHQRVDVLKLLIAAGANVDTNPDEIVPTMNNDSPIHLAAESGHAPCVRLLLESGATPELRNENGETPLLLALHEDHSDVVATLVEFGADINAKRVAEEDFDEEDVAEDNEDDVSTENEDDFLTSSSYDEDDDDEEAGGPALVLAARQGAAKSLRILLDAGAIADPAALVEAARTAHRECIEILLNHGYSARDRDANGMTPLHALGQLDTEITLLKTRQPIDERSESEWTDVAAGLQFEISDLLLERGADPNATDPRGVTPLMLAARAKTFVHAYVKNDDSHSMYHSSDVDTSQFVRRLTEAGAEVMAQDDVGNTALHHSFFRDNFGSSFPAITKILLDAGAEIDAKNHLGQTPLMLACRRKDDSIDLLVKRGADVNATDARGRSAIYYAIHSFLPAETIKKLLACDVDLTIKDAAGNTPLDHARANYEEEAAELLNEAGAESTSKREFQLADAMKEGDLKRIRSLLTRGADPHRVIHGRNAFTAAIDTSNVEIIEEMIEHGMDVQTCTVRYFGSKSSPLFPAAGLEDDALLKMLLRRGADPKARNDKGWTPVTVAAFMRRHKNLATLLDAGGELDVIAEDFLEMQDFGQRTSAENYQRAVARVTQAIGAEPSPLGWHEGLVYWQVDATAEIEQRAKEQPDAPRFIISSQVPKEKVNGYVDQLQPRLRDDGVLLVGVRSGRGCSPSSENIALFPTTNKFAVIAAMGTNGNEVEISNPELIGILRDLDADQPFDLIRVVSDGLDIRFHELAHDPEAMGRRLYKICPDMIDQGFDTMRKLVDNLKLSRDIHFWWD